MAWVASDGGAVPHATDHVDLMDKFRDFIVANGAVEMEFSSGVSGIWKLTGSGDDEILFGTKIFTHVPLNNYAWILNGFTGYTPGQVWDNQLGAVINSPAALALWGSTIPYWFFINSRRAIVVAKVSTGYHMAYFGFILPYGTPAQWAYPLCVSGSTYRADTDTEPNQVGRPYLFSDPLARVSNFWCPLYQERSIGTLLIRLASGWRRLRNAQSFNTSSIYRWSGTFPYYWQYLDNFRNTPDGKYQRRAVDLIDGSEPWGILGSFDGLFFTPGVGLAPESVISDPDTSEEFLAFPNTSRESVGNWVLVRKA